MMLSHVQKTHMASVTVTSLTLTAYMKRLFPKMFQTLSISNYIFFLSHVYLPGLLLSEPPIFIREILM